MSNKKDIRTKHEKKTARPWTKPTAKTEDTDSERTMIFEKKDVELLYRALRAYHPTEKEEHLHAVLIENLEETLAIDFEMLDIEY